MDEKRILDLLAEKKKKKEDFAAQICAKNLEHIALKNEVEKSLEDGNIDGAIEARKKIGRVNEEIASINARRKNYIKDDGDIMAAWKEYRAEYEKEYKKALSGLQKGRNSLKKAFYEVLKLQNEALSLRDSMRSAGLNPSILEPALYLSTVKVPLKMGASQIAYIPEIAYLYAVGELRQEEAIKAKKVTNYPFAAIHVDDFSMSEEEKKYYRLFGEL